MDQAMRPGHVCMPVAYYPSDPQSPLIEPSVLGPKFWACAPRRGAPLGTALPRGLSVLLPNARRATKVEARTKERFVGGQLELEFGAAASAAGAAGGFVLGAGRVKNVAFTRA